MLNTGNHSEELKKKKQNKWLNSDHAVEWTKSFFWVQTYVCELKWVTYEWNETIWAEMIKQITSLIFGIEV